MAHRYATRSTTRTPLITDLTQFESSRGRRNARSSRRGRPPSVRNADTNSVQGEIVCVEITMERASNLASNLLVRNDGKMESGDNKKETLPCVIDSPSGIPELINCPVCFEPLSASREPMATRCGHLFCKGCLTMSLNGTKLCPTCQSVADISTSIRVYF